MLDASTITLLFAGTSLAGAALSVALALKLADQRIAASHARVAKLAAAKANGARV